MVVVVVLALVVDVVVELPAGIEEVVVVGDVDVVVVLVEVVVVELPPTGFLALPGTWSDVFERVTPSGSKKASSVAFLPE